MLRIVLVLSLVIGLSAGFIAAAALSAGALGNPAQGSQAGDRTLAAAATDELCFKVNLPTASGNTFQNATTTATFTFDSEQTVNNP